MSRRNIILRQLGIGALMGGLCISLIALGRGTAKDPREGTWEVIGADELEVRTDPHIQTSSEQARNEPERFEFLERIVPEISGQEMTLDQVAELVRKVADVNVMVKWSVLTSLDIDRTTKRKITLKNLKVAQFLKVVLNEFRLPDMGYAAESNLITISTKDDLGQLEVVRIYNVRDLMLNSVRVGALFKHDQQSRGSGSGAGIFSPGKPRPLLTEERLFDSLHEILIQTVDPNSWVVNGGRMVAFYWAGTLVIKQSPENHQRIGTLLRMMREAARREVVEPTTKPESNRPLSPDASR